MRNRVLVFGEASTWSAVVRPGVAGQVAPVATTPVEISLSRFSLATEEYAVGPAAETWGNLNTLAEHFASHGKDFAATSPEEYARAAAQFCRRARLEHLPMKIDHEDGTVRFFDPATDTFGSYRLDGRTRSFFKPKKAERYWIKQPGEETNG